MNNEKIIRDFYRLGLQANKQGERADGKYGRGVVAQFAREKGVSVEHVYKAKRFASLYSEQELDRFCRRRSPQGKSLGVDHVYVLIEVSDPKERRRLESEAAKRGWSVRDLKRERKKTKTDDSAVTHGGRPERAAASTEDLVQQLEEHIQRFWRQWVTVTAY